MKQQSDIIETLAELVETGAPLAAGLRAAADETVSSRMAKTLRKLSRCIEAGDNLETAFQSSCRGVQSYVLAAVNAGIRTGRLGQVLAELVQLQRFRGIIWRRYLSSLAYPLSLLLLLTLVMWIISAIVIPSVAPVIRDFGLELSHPTEVLFWWAESGWKLVGCFLLGLFALSILTRIAVGAAPWRWFLTTLPLFGPVVQWISMAEFARLLRVYLSQNVPLPESLRLTAAGLRDANMAVAAREAAVAVESGRPLHQHLDGSFRVAKSMVPIIAWGESQNRLVEALDLAVEMFEGRVIQQTGWINTVLPPLTFILIAAMVAMVVIGLYLPFISLIEGLA